MNTAPSRRWGTIAVAALTSVVLSLTAATSASADGPDAGDTATTVDQAAPDAVSVVSPELSGGALVAETGSATVALPPTGATDVLVAADGATDATIAIGLPNIVSDATAQVADDGTVVYDNGSDVTVAVQALPTAVRAAAVLENADAPLEYAYQFAGLTPRLNSDGSVTLSAAGDGFTADIAQLDIPWAFDADGRAVPTHYRIAGDTVVQVVEHQSAGYSYPIVADPTVQHDCGIISCTVRFDRTTSKNIRDGYQLGAIASGVVAALTGFVPLAVVVASFGVAQVAAARYIENGNCVGQRYYVTGYVPIEVKRGTYNCA